jgi:hypothetical protein
VFNANSLSFSDGIEKKTERKRREREREREKA